MPDLTKIATCSYCGNRSVLRLAGKVQHELSCGSCGARLHTMKAMPMPAPAPTRREATARRPAPQSPRYSSNAPRKSKKTRKTRSPLKRFSELIEDIWDEVEDIFD